MSDVVSWILTVDVKPGELETFRALMDELVTHTKTETGALTYEWFVTDDGTQVDLYERYTDSDAAMVHLRAFGEHYARRFMASVTPSRFRVYGDPNEAVRGALTRMGAEFLGTFGGFAR